MKNISENSKNRVYCSCCGKQVTYDLKIHPSPNDEFLTKRLGSRASCTPGEVICGYCSEDLDENGLFPEERAQF